MDAEMKKEKGIQENEQFMFHVWREIENDFFFFFCNLFISQCALRKSIHNEKQKKTV